MNEPTLASLHPLHFADQHSHRSLMSQALHGSFFLNLPHVSRSPELSRAYQVGDPVRLIDWKAFARNDQLIVREERDEAMASVVVVLDTRSTMVWPDKTIEKESKKETVTKFSIAARIALHLVHRHLRLGDRVRIVLWNENNTENTLPCIELRSPSHVLSLFEDLEKSDFKVTSLESFSHPNTMFYPRTNLLFWISDCCMGEIPSEYFSQSQSTVLFHVLSSLETDASWFQDRTSFFDKFSKEKEFLGAHLKSKNQYSNKLQAWFGKLQETVEKSHGLYVLFTEDSSIRSYISTLDGIV